MTQVIETPILIVGAGAVGLSLGLELSHQGIPFMLVERGDGIIEHPRTGLIAIRTMEFCRRWGIAGRVRACGFPDDYRLSIVFCTSLNGFVLAREDYPGMAETPVPEGTPEKRQRCPQMWFDPILKKALAERPQADIRYGHELQSFHADAEGVQAEVLNRASGEHLQIRAAYMVGCDGVQSTVREALGIPMQGNPALSYSVNILFRCPGLLEAHDKGEAERYLFVQPEGSWANLTVVDGRQIWRLTVLGSPEKLDLARFDARAAVLRAVGRDDLAFEVLSVQPWRRSQLLAERWRAGRVLLAGDAVHTMSPTGGMGMNTGAQDAMDLGWKLAAMLRGWGGPRLLDSYEPERRPVAARNAAFSSRNFRAWLGAGDSSKVLDPGEEGARTRAAIGQAMRESTRAEWESTGLQIGYRYEGSPVIIPDGTPPTPDDDSIYVPTARPGSRAPHAPLADGRSMLDLFGPESVLLRLGAQPPEARPFIEAARARGMPLRVEWVPDAAVHRLYERALVLVRPDGHVAWRADALPADAGAVLDRLRGA